MTESGASSAGLEAFQGLRFFVTPSMLTPVSNHPQSIGQRPAPAIPSARTGTLEVAGLAVTPQHQLPRTPPPWP